MQVVSAPNLGEYSDWTASDTIPVMSTGKLVGKVPSYTSTGEISVRLFVYVRTAVAAETSLLLVRTAGTVIEWDVRLQPDGDLRIIAKDNDGATVLDSTFAFGMNTRGFTILDLELSQNGTGIDWRVLIIDFNNTDTINDSLSTVFLSGTLASSTLGRASYVTVGNNQGLTDVIVGHLAVASDLDAYANTNEAITAHNGENPSSRMTRMCLEEDVPFVSITKGQTGNEVTLGDQRIKTLLEILQEAAETDLGILHETRDQFAIAYRSRLSLYNQDPALTLDHSAHELGDSLNPVDDDQATKNDVKVTRIDGSSYRAELTEGTLSTQAPPYGVGRYETTFNLSLESDDQLADQAGFRLSLSTVDEARYPTVVLNLAHPTFTDNLDMMNAALTIDVGDRILIQNPPSFLPPDDISLLVQGYSETFDQFEHTITLNCTPYSPWSLGIADDDVFGRADTDGSELRSGIDSSATSISVTTTSGPIWTTDVADFPFDVTVGGEVMTVTAISGSSSPQTFTVTRSTNGVVKSHVAGTDLRLTYPTIASL